MTITEILTKIYGYINRIKVELAFMNIAGVWNAINELSDYLISIDVSDEKPRLPPQDPQP